MLTIGKNILKPVAGLLAFLMPTIATKGEKIDLGFLDCKDSPNLFCYQHARCQVVYSEDIKYLQDEFAYLWLVDKIASYQTREFRAANFWQSWHLSVEPESAVLTCKVDGGDPIVVENILGRDLPLSLTIWLETSTDSIFLYLP
jgi:hypothetical protein